MQIFFDKREELAPTIWQYFFRPERRVDFIPGQYVNVALYDVINDPRGPGRTFTLTSLPADDHISFVVKIPAKHSPYKETLANLAAGTEAKIFDAMGDLILPKDPAVPLVFIAGGIGISSFISMLKELTKKREERQIFLFYALRDRRERIFRDITDVYPLALQNITIAPNRLVAKQITDSTPPDAQLYISGSERFVEGQRIGLEQLGTPRSQIAFDYYDGYTEL